MGENLQQTTSSIKTTHLYMDVKHNRNTNKWLSINWFLVVIKKSWNPALYKRKWRYRQLKISTLIKRNKWQRWEAEDSVKNNFSEV